MCVSLWDLHQPNKYLGGKLFASPGPANHEMLVQGMLALFYGESKNGQCSIAALHAYSTLQDVLM